MTLLPPTASASRLDLVEQARRRARLAGLLGRLLAEEPGAGAAPLVEGVPALAALGSGDPALAAAYERLLLREVPPYESVFLGDGQRGGDVAGEVGGAYARLGCDAQVSWRVAGPDHLGVELWCYAWLCVDEAEGWERDEPDRAASAVEAERDFLAAHLGRWAGVAATALARRAGDSPYGALAEAVSTFVDEECERLRPAPDHSEMAPVEVEPAPRALAPARLTRWLLAPGRCGAYLDVDDLAGAAASLGIPWRPSDVRSRFVEVAEAAAASGDLAAVLEALRPRIEEWRDSHATREATRGGNRRVWTAWRLRAEQTLALIERVATASSAPLRPSRGPLMVTVSGPGPVERGALAREVIARVSALGVQVAVSMTLDETLCAVVGGLLDGGVGEVLFDGTGLAGLVWRQSVGEDLRLPDAHADVVVAVVATPGRVAVVIGEPPADSRDLAERVGAALDAVSGSTGPA